MTMIHVLLSGACIITAILILLIFAIWSEAAKSAKPFILGGPISGALILGSIGCWWLNEIALHVLEAVGGSILVIQVIGMSWAWFKVAQDLTDNPWWWRLGIMTFWPITWLTKGVNVQ